MIEYSAYLWPSIGTVFLYALLLAAIIKIVEWAGKKAGFVTSK